MRDYRKEAANKVEIAIWLLMLAAIVSTFYGITGYFSLMISLATWIITAILTTAVVQVLIQRVSGNLFERIPLTFEVKGFRFSISLFVIFTIILKLVILS